MAVFGRNAKTAIIHMRRILLSKTSSFGEQLSRSRKILSSGKKEKTDKGKLPERVGRKVMGLKFYYGCQTADFFYYFLQASYLFVAMMY